MSKIKTLAPIVLAVLLALSFYKLFSDKAAVKAEYNKYVESARDYAEQGIAVDAINEYSKALQINDSLELSLEIGNFYLKMDDIGSAIGWGETMIEDYSKEPKAYEFLLSCYYKNNDYHSSFALIDKIEKSGLSTKGIKEIANKVKYLYFYSESFENAGSFNKGLCPVEVEGKWGFVDKSGSKKVRLNYASVGTFMTDVAPVETFDGEWYYIDKAGNKKVVIKGVKNIKGLGSFGGEYYPVFDGESWAYYSTKFVKTFGDYEYASTMANGFASVKEKDFYYIINNKGEKLSNQKYSEIVEDYKGIITRNNVFFVNIDGLYYMLDANGKKVTETGYLSAELFLDETYAAVETKKGWCFIDNKGKEVFDGVYFDEAKSFSNGLAAVKKNGRWGFINTDGEVAIDYTFEDAQHFSTEGTAFVKQEDIWTLICLYSYNYEK